MELSPEQRRVLLDVARSAIRCTLQREAVAALEETDPAMGQLAGCFVTLHEAGTHRLRGCIGRLDAHGPLLGAVQQTAVNVLEDPRFVQSDPVRLEELPRLELEITVLSPLRPAANTLDFDLLNDGIYLTFGDRAGCFLPQVARETGWSKEQLLDRLCTEKMGLSSLIWRNPHAKLFVFSTLIVGPEAFVAAG